MVYLLSQTLPQPLMVKDDAAAVAWVAVRMIQLCCVLLHTHSPAGPQMAQSLAEGWSKTDVEP
jgi:hypothetical protein